MKNLVGWPQPIMWPLFGFGAEVEFSMSVHGACAEAVQTVIQGLGLSGVTSANVVIRKFQHLKASDAAKLKTSAEPTVAISTHLPVSQAAASNLRDDIVYPVTVGLFAPANADLESNQARMLLWRQLIRKAFINQRLSGVDSVWTCQIPPSQPFHEAWHIGGMTDHSPMTLNFISRETRGV
jgi:hypothetical protein